MHIKFLFLWYIDFAIIVPNLPYEHRCSFCHLNGIPEKTKKTKKKKQKNKNKNKKTKGSKQEEKNINKKQRTRGSKQEQAIVIALQKIGKLIPKE